VGTNLGFVVHNSRWRRCGDSHAANPSEAVLRAAGSEKVRFQEATPMADILNVTLILKRLKYTEGQVPATPSPTLRLFVNNIPVTPFNVPTDFVECSATGYAAASLTPANWTNTAEGSAYFGVYPTVTFTMSNGLGQTVYGYYVTDQTDISVMWGGLFLTPFAIPDSGGSVAVTPTFTDEACPGFGPIPDKVILIAKPDTLRVF